MSISSSSARSAAWLVVRFAGRHLANSIAFFVIAALLTPEEFGIAAMAVAAVAVARTGLSRGLRDVVIQRKDIGATAEDTAWWLNAGFGLALFAVVSASSFAVSRAMGDQTLIPLTCAAAVSLLFVGVSAVQEARLERNFEHKRLTTAQVLASICSASLAVLVALSGGGAWSLVVLTVSEAFALMISTLALSKWHPGFAFSLAEARDQIRFAAPLSLSFTFTTGNIRIAQIIVGLLAGADSAGFFRIASQVNQLLTQVVGAPLSQVLLPAFSRASGPRGPQFTKALAAMCAVTLPAFLGAAALAPELIPLVLGAQWAPAGAVSGILCFGVFAALMGQVLTPLLIAEGAGRLASISSIGGVAVGLVATAIGAAFGPLTAALGFVSRGVFTLPLGIEITRRRTGLPRKRQWAAILGYAVPAAIMYVAVRLFLTNGITAEIDPWLRLTLGVLIGGALYAILVRVIVRATLPEVYMPLAALAPARLRRFL